MSNKISVIIPAYNAEKHIGKCIESIQNSDYTDLEIIIVNDGSKDNTLGIINSYANADSRIVVVDKENGGVSSARNMGLDRAKGEYITFIDSDDYVAPDFFSALLKQCLDGADISTCSYEMVDLDGKPISVERKIFKDSFEITPQQIADDYFTYLDYGIINFSCSKMFSRKAIGSERFSTELKWAEDGSFNIKVFENINKLAYVPKKLYFYVVYSGQTTSKRMPGYADMMIQHICDIDRYIKMYDGYKKERVRQGMARCCLGVLKEACYHSKNLREYRSAFRKFKKQEWMSYLPTLAGVELKWKVLKFFVKFNMPSMIYSITAMHSKLSKKKLNKKEDK